MALKFRRGTTAQQSGSLAFGEPYVNTTLGTLVIGGASGDIILGTTGTGSTGTFGDISGSGLDITGNARIGGNLTLGGAITIGDATADTINVIASISSSIVPESTNAFDIGSSTKIYRTIYGGIISGSTLQIMSSANPELRLINKTSGVAYHIQNGAAGALHIHNATTDTLLLRFASASLQDDHSAEFFGSLSVSKSISSPTITGINTFTGSTNTRLTNLENKTGSLATTGSNTFKGNQTIIGSGAGFAAYISTSVNDATLGLDTTANVNAAYFLKNGEKNFEVSYDTTNANGIFRLLPYDNSSYFEIGNPSNSGADYVFISEATYGNILMGPGIGNATSYLAGATPATDKVQIAGNLYVSGAIKANSFTGSIAATNGVVSGSSQVVDILTSLNSLTSSYARTNTANTFTGNQTITGSLYISQDLVVAGSSSIQNISSSRLDIGDNIIQLNVNNPSLRFGGLAIYDSGSAGTSGSFLYDSLHDEFIFVHRGNGTNVTSSHFVLGPETYDNLGTETYLTNNRLPKGTGKEHLVDSNITDTGTLITLGSNTVVNGTIVASGTSLISGSSQLNGTTISNLSGSFTGSLSGTLSGVASLATTVAVVTTGTTTDTTLYPMFSLNPSPNTYITPTTHPSGSFYYNGVTRQVVAEGFVGGIYATNGVVSGSSQVVGSSITTNTITIGSTSTALGGTSTTLAGLTSVSSTGFTGALTGNASTATTLQTARTINGTSFDGSANITIANLVSGSSQISFGGVTGLVSNSQLSNNSITIAGTSTALGGTISAATILQGTGVVSGSSQVQLGSASGNIALATQTTGDYVASLVAGTGITLSNNSGEGATPTIAIGQSVATNATPTFGNLTINGSINATGDITAYYTSDKRHKNNIQPITDALLKVSKLNGVTWEWNDDVHEVTKSTPKTGLIAQEVQEVLPEVIKEREDGFLALDYSKMMGLMVEAIKEQQTQIHNLTLEIENLKKVKGL